MKKIFPLILSTCLFVISCSSNDNSVHKHTFSSTWSYNEAQHWHDSTCEHDVVSNLSSHVFSTWVISKPATETEDGSKYRECSICHYIDEEIIPMTGGGGVHEHTYSSTWSYNETHHWHDSTCGHNVKDSYETHSFGAWIIDNDATETTNGKKHKNCLVCDYKVEEVIPATGGGGEITPDPEEEQPSEIDSIQDMTILHAWDWKLNDIKTRLKRIKKAGYGAIQTSPMQPHVDKASGANGVTQNNWWKLYQPLAFKVATDNENILGTKSDLTALCAAAKEEGLKIIVDVVCNHLAGSGSGYNNQVYTKYPLHNYGAFSDSSQQAVVQGHIGLPDLDTSNDELQQDVLNMMKEYIDCGVSGFRFDAAKHIETPDDGPYASDFWPTVLGGTTAYALDKGYDNPYYYGEILGTCGANRSFDFYTKFMSVVDSNNGGDVIQAVTNGSTSLLPKKYETEQEANKLVLWSESHDNYANTYEDTTRNVDVSLINKGYVIQAAKKDTATLYYARPETMNASMCSIEDNGGWQYEEVKAINKFHNRYVDKDENMYNAYGVYVNERGKGSYAGATFVSLDLEPSPIELTTKVLEDGKYIDLVSKNEFTVTNHKVNVSFTNGVCILIPKSAYVEEEEEQSYVSSIVIEDAPTDKTYLAWVWGNNTSGSWKSFNKDLNAIGLSLSAGQNYLIAEFPLGTTTSTANWNNVIRQTVDMSYNGNQQIISFANLSWKS